MRIDISTGALCELLKKRRIKKPLSNTFLLISLIIYSSFLYNRSKYKRYIPSKSQIAERVFGCLSFIASSVIKATDLGYLINIALSRRLKPRKSVRAFSKGIPRIPR
jgi:hypothetical protein